MQYARPDLWRSTYASMPAAATPWVSPADGVVITQAEALLLATQLLDMRLIVSGTMFVDLPSAPYTGTLDLAMNVSMSGGGVYGVSGGGSVRYADWFFSQDSTAPYGDPLPAPFVRPDPASRVLANPAIISWTFGNWNAQTQDSSRHASSFNIAIVRSGGVFRLEYGFLFSQNPSAGASPPFYMCNPANPGVYPLRASGTWNFLGHVLQWEARSPVSSGSDTWGPANGCAISLDPVFT